MNHTWAFNQLNQLTPSPGISPSNGPVQERNEMTLSFPCDGNALQAQLEQWTNVAFDFDSPDFGSDPAPPLPAFDESKPLIASPFTSRGAQSLFSPEATAPAASVAAATTSGPAEDSTIALSALLAPSSASPDSTSPFSGSLVDPELALPSFSHAAAALPASFFSSPTAFDPALLESTSTAAPSPASTSTLSTAAASAAKGKKSTTAASPTGPPAAKKKRASTVEKSKALPLPEGVNTEGMTEEELNALAIEEDKRRRNTAASARFRVKKKQREQALEQSAKELRDRVAALEKDVESLRTENGWLRSLITDKSVLQGKDGASNNKKRVHEDDEAIDPSLSLSA
ncbi:hypothetical protein JCM10212_003453 [Sporobolomyces blumeae]